MRVQDYVETKEVDTKSCDMGQNLSIGKPKISLTWILREQQQQTTKKSSVTSKKARRHSKERLFNEKYVSGDNLNEFQIDKCKTTETNANLYRKCNQNHRKHNNEKPKKIFAPQGDKSDLLLNNNNIIMTNISSGSSGKEKIISLKNTYSEPSLYTTLSEPATSKKHRHRRRRERYRSQRYGYEIKNVDEFLTTCSLSKPGNIPMVLSSSCILYQTRSGGYQNEISLPLGMIVNAVFKNQHWLYVQTPHAEEGYIPYSVCLPLGILPQKR